MATQQVLFVGLLKTRLSFGVVGLGDFDRDADRDLTGLDGAQQPMFAVFQQSKDGPDVFDGQAGLPRDLRCLL